MLTPSKPPPSIKPPLIMKGKDIPNLPLRHEEGGFGGTESNLPLRRFGGQYAPAIGISTRLQKTALLDWFERERQALAGQQDVPW